MISTLLRFLISGAGLKTLAAVGLAAGLAWSHWQAYSRGWAANEAEHAEETRQLNERLAAVDEANSILAAHVRRLKAEDAELQEQNENEREADPTGDDPHGFSLERLRRLDAIR